MFGNFVFSTLALPKCNQACKNPLGNRFSPLEILEKNIQAVFNLSLTFLVLSPFFLSVYITHCIFPWGEGDCYYGSDLSKIFKMVYQEGAITHFSEKDEKFSLLCIGRDFHGSLVKESSSNPRVNEF